MRPLQPATCESPTSPPLDLWDESGEYLWLRADVADTPERAKRIAFVGHDPKRTVVLPETFFGGQRYGYDEIDVTVEPLHLRPGNEDEHGWAGSGADTWWRCEADDPLAVAYWQVTV